LATNFTNQDIINSFVDVDLEEYGYNNEDFYKGSAQRMRYLLVTRYLSPENALDGGQLELGQEDNRFCECITFGRDGSKTFKVHNEKVLKELMMMTEEELEDYITDNNYDWLGDDYDHIHEYLNFVSGWQDEWQFYGADMDDQDQMTIIKEGWIIDVESGFKSDNKYEVAYNILNEYWDSLPDDHKESIHKRLEAIGV